MWIAFKLYFYWVLWQRIGGGKTTADSCELLSNCIFTGFFDNVMLLIYVLWIVVNCFQIVFLLGSLTTNGIIENVNYRLWIAFKLYFYWVLWQHFAKHGKQFSSCELLSNCIFTGFFDNRSAYGCHYSAVVNCFQIVFLLGSLTTSGSSRASNVLLWIAFKLYFYWVLWQQHNLPVVQRGCCELLSNCIFTGFFDNRNRGQRNNCRVVNCFQIVFLLGSLTTWT